MSRLCFISLLALVLLGCSGKDFGRDLSSWSDERLLFSVWDKKADVIDEEVVDQIQKRGIVPDAEWSLIRQQDIAEGMSESGLMASLGKPDRTSIISTWDGLQSDYVFIDGNTRYKVSVKKGAVISQRRF